MPHLVKVKIQDVSYYWFDGFHRVDVFKDSSDRMEEWVAHYFLNDNDTKVTFEDFKNSLPDIELYENFNEFVKSNNITIN